MGRNKPVPKYLYGNGDDLHFVMVTANLLQSEGFQELSRPAQLFYLICCAHKNTEMQRQCLYKTLEEYFNLLDDPKSEYDLKLLSGQIKNRPDDKMYFVFPASHLKLYGITPQYASKYKRELIEHGFIRVVGNEKGKRCPNQDFSKRITIYAFNTGWKKQNPVNQ
ncbi:MAG: hypothetical protein K5852_05095 [Eubacterium sp.]|nr:hypothetical protein [Eubacterium sp.]